MARQKNVENMSYQEALDTATVLGVALEGDDIYQLRDKIKEARALEVQPPSVGELIQIAAAEDEAEDKTPDWVSQTEKQRVTKALKPYTDNGLKVSYGKDTMGGEWYTTTFGGHSESNHITTPTRTVRERAAMQMQSIDYKKFSNNAIGA